MSLGFLTINTDTDTKLKMLPFLVCFSALLQASLSTPVLAVKPKPIEMKYSCMVVIPADHPKQRTDNVPVILLHGLSETKESWHGVSEILALDTKKKVCIADLRNHGESPWNDDEYDVEALTEDVKHMMDRLRAQKAIIVGHSLGGKTAVHLALNSPERVEKIVVEDMRPNGVTPEGMQQVQFYIQLMRDLEKDIPQGVTEIEAKTVLMKLMNERLEKLNMTVKLKDPTIIPIKCSEGICQLRTNPVLLDAILKTPYDVLIPSSGRFDGPALFIYGGKSKFRVADDESNIKKLFPNAKLVAVEGAGHTTNTFPKFTREVIKFINDE